MRTTRVTAFLAFLSALVVADSAFALIIGGEGNVPLDDPGWPKGAAEVFNDRTRIAYWEGPPFGGGEYHGEYKGDADDLQRMLDALAGIEGASPRVVTHDRTAESFWLTTTDKSQEHPMDWEFTVWVPDRFEIQRGWSVGDNATVPQPQIDVYLGRGLDWSAISIPDGVELIDQTLAGHGFTTEDGAVLEGTVLAVGNSEPLPEATVTLQLIETPPEGGYTYNDALSVETDADGNWVMTNAPDGWYQVVVGKEGYLSRVIGYVQFEGQPGWQTYSARLARAVEVSGIVTDSNGQPLSEVRVRLSDLKDIEGELYEAPGLELTSDDEGRFSALVTEGGTLSPWAYADGYVHVGLPEPFEIGSGEVAITLHSSGNLHVVVDFSKRVSTGDYLVEIEPEVGGDEIGSWGGSATVDADGSYLFENVPPGRYTLRGRPNPGSTDEETNPKTVEVVAGETVEVVLEAKP